MRKLYLALFFAILSIVSIQSLAQVSAYSYSQSNGTYTAITGGTVLGNTSSDDERFVDPASPLGGTTTTGVGFPIGFTFKYNGTDYDRLAVNNNGWISLGISSLTPAVDITSTSSYTPLASTSTHTNANLRARIGGMGRDLQGQTGSSIRLETIGTAPNRQCVVQFTNYKRFGTAGTGDNFNFQIILNETTNTVQVVFGTMVFNTTTTTSSICHVGLGGNASTDFNNRQTTAPHNWNATTAGTTNTQGCQNATSTIAVTAPASGLTMTWTAPACQSPSGIVASAITLTSATISWTASGTATSYDWEIRTSGACGSGAPIQSGNSATTSVNLTGLNPSTTYTFCISSSCAGPTSSAWISSTFTTLCAPVNVPYLVNFDGVTTPALPVCTAVQDVNGGTTWATVAAPTGYTGNILRYGFSSTLPGDDWFYTNAVHLVAGTTYKLKLRYGNNSSSFSEAMEVKYGTVASPAGMTTSLLNYPVITGNSPTNDSTLFVPSATGDYYFGFHSYSDVDQWNLYLDDISITELPAADIGAIAINTPTVYCPDPAASNLEAVIQNFGASTIDFASNPATITVNVGGAGSGTLTGTLNTGTLAVGGTATISLTPAFSFAASGNYTFEVIATAVGDGNSSNSTFNGSKFINSVPVVNLGADVDQCTNTGIVLSANTQPAGSSYVWNTGATTPTLTATATGQYYLTVTSPLINGPGTKTFTTNTPVGIFDLQTVNSTQAVSGLTRTTMSATSINQVCINITHTWNSDMDIQLVSPSGTIMDLSIGNGGSGDNYTNTCFSPSASVPIFSGTSPFTGTFLPEEPFTVFNGQNPNGNWSLRVTDFFNGDQGTINSWFIVFNDSIPTPGTGCSAADTINATVRPVPLVDLGPDAIVCAGGTKTLNPGTQPTGSTFLWNNNATTSTLVAASTGLYWVEVTNSQACSKRDSINVTVIAPIVTTLNLPFDTLYVNSPITALSGGSPAGTGGVYSGVGISGTSINPAAFPQGNHQVTYTFTDANGCVGTASDVFTVVANTANKVNLYPNPSTGGNFRMVVAADFVGAFVTAYDQTGHKMGSWTLGGKLNDYSLDWPAGRYTLIIRNSAGVEVQKQLIIVK